MDYVRARKTPYYNLYESIVNLDSKIRFVTIIDSNDRLILGVQNEVIKNYFIYLLVTV